MLYNKINWKSLPNESTPINSVNLGIMDNQIEILTNALYPINIIVPFYDDVDRSDWLGYSWEKVGIGKTLVGQDTNQTEFNTIGKNGGSKTHTITESQMPIHRHAVRYQNELNFSGNASVQTAGFANDRIAFFKADGSASVSDMIASDTGGNQPHNNLQPYEVVTYWRRIS